MSDDDAAIFFSDRHAWRKMNPLSLFFNFASFFPPPPPPPLVWHGPGRRPGWAPPPDTTTMMIVASSYYTRWKNSVSVLSSVCIVSNIAQIFTSPFGRRWFIRPALLLLLLLYGYNSQWSDLREAKGYYTNTWECRCLLLLLLNVLDSLSVNFFSDGQAMSTGNTRVWQTKSTIKFDRT